MIESGTLLQNRYLIERQIGEGGMGAVHLAIDQRFDSKVAIKETFYKDNELGEAFEREARLLNSLHHPVLPHVSDFFAENNGYFLVMQFIEGEDLFEILKREGAFPLKDVLRWTDSLLDALDYLHSQEPPIIHRDIKPQNLKITPRGDIILLDFGLAKLSSEDTLGMKSVFGYSRKYSPLEQIQGTGTDARSDIFSLAATAYHLLTGKPPAEVIARASAIISGNPDPLRLASEINDEIPLDVASVLHSALALNADKRFESAKAMRLALEHAVNAIPNENELPQPVPAVTSGSSSSAADSVDDENFTALESFAADAAAANTAINLPETDNNEKLPAVQMPISNPVITNSTPKVVPQESYIAAITEVVPRARPRHFRFAVLGVLLVCTALSVLYFITKTNSSSEPDQNLSVQTGEKANSATSDSKIVSAQSSKKANGSALPENAEQAKTEFSAGEKDAEKKEINDKSVKTVEKTENPEIEEEPGEISESAPPENPRRRQAKKTVQTLPEANEEEPVPDIESIFTGRSSEQQPDETNQPKDERRKQGEKISEEEWREKRRQRRQERRQRQNENNIPF